MKKYTVSVNEYEYCVGIFETEKEAWDKAIELFKERYGTEEDDDLFNVLEIEVK